MVAIGVILLNNNLNAMLEKFKLEEKHQFIVTDLTKSSYKTEVSCLTYKEAQAKLQKIPISDDNIDSIKIPGITKEELIEFKKTYRYYPTLLKQKLIIEIYIIMIKAHTRN